MMALCDVHCGPRLTLRTSRFRVPRGSGSHFEKACNTDQQNDVLRDLRQLHYLEKHEGPHKTWDRLESAKGPVGGG